MPPQIALIICVCFVIALLRMDYLKGRGSVTGMLWLPVLWAFYCASRPVSFWFAIDPSMELGGDIESGNVFERNILSLFIVAGLIVLLRRGVNLKEVIRENAALLMLFAFMGASVLWSDYPWVSIKRWVKNAGGVVMVLVVLTEPAPYQSMNAIFRRLAYVLIPFSAVLVKYFPRQGVAFGRWSGEPSWIGVCMQKNGLGLLCMLSIFFLVWSMICRRWAGDLRSEE